MHSWCLINNRTVHTTQPEDQVIRHTTHGCGDGLFKVSQRKINIMSHITRKNTLFANLPNNSYISF